MGKRIVNGEIIDDDGPGSQGRSGGASGRPQQWPQGSANQHAGAAITAAAENWWQREPFRVLPDGVGLRVVPVPLPDVALFGLRVTALQYTVAAVVTFLMGVRALIFLALCWGIAQLNSTPRSSAQRPATGIGAQSNAGANGGSSTREIQDFMKNYLASDPGGKSSAAGATKPTSSPWASAGKARKLND
mmetsp:Transcript_8228/g.24526  ORF Transcript_8228/g.24526 Transcript_8228/m.24526 type:complete len:189 (+) Transcript_8228:2829-3395(+)